MTDNTSLIELLQSMLAIPSPSGDESAVADYLCQWLQQRGLTPGRVGNNLWLESEPAGIKPTVLLNGHIDRVPEAADQRKGCDGQTLYGRGANDDGGSVVALLGAYLALTQEPLPYRLVWTATAEEENSGIGGLPLLLPHVGEVNLGIIGEPTGMQMAVAERGLLVVDAYAHGVAGHAARNEGVNALYKALDDIQWVRNYRFPKVSDYLGEVKMTTTMIEAGERHNVIPDSCHFVIDIRPNGCYSNEAIMALLRDNMQSNLKARNMTHGSSQIAMDHPVVRAAQQLQLPLFGSPTMSNQALIASSDRPFPTVKIGPGESARSHTKDEYITRDEILNGIDTYVALLKIIAL